jgi:fructokinase
MNQTLAALELGGTKTVVALGDHCGAVLEEWRYPTTTPQETLDTACRWLRERGAVDRLGIASFGPLRLDPRAHDYATMLQTPKQSWRGFSFANYFSDHWPELKFCIDTDVQAALWAEMSMGAAQQCREALYITIGTGIGAGMACHGRLVHGCMHPEMGHLMVRRHPDDRFAGLCPNHGDCWEGLASGPAIEKRWGQPAHTLPPDHPAWDMQAYYLAQGLWTASTMFSPQVMILGGGVSQAPGLREKVIHHLAWWNGDYLEALDERVKLPVLQQNAGIVGALLLAAQRDENG